MKLALVLLAMSVSGCVFAQTWKTLPKGVRIVGYRNVTTSKIDSNFNQFRSETSLGATFKIDGATLNNLSGNFLNPSNIDPDAVKALTVGEYAVDASAQANVHGSGIGYGLTDRVMFYAELAFYNANVNANLKRTRGNSYKKVADLLSHSSDPAMQALSENINRLPDVNEKTIQSVITDYYGYKPIGTWQGSGYGDLETGLMFNVLDRSTWGVLLYPGIVLPTGRQDDPDILQDMGFGDGQFDAFGEMATGYIFNDYLKVGTTFRYTYQHPTDKKLRVQQERDFTLSRESGTFNVKYGDKINWMFNSTYSINDWISVTPVYRFMYQMPSSYNSDFGDANKYMAYNSDKQEHQVQLTTSLSSITPFLKKQFLLPAQINFNVVQTVAGKNVPKANRIEFEFRMIF